jgi:tripartite-type tricarboxylate transporter receptor subunit TctC
VHNLILPATKETMMKHILVTALLSKLLIAGIAGNAYAQPANSYPAKPVRVLVPYAPGGATDIIARHVTSRLSEATGQQFIVDNRSGASGNIALELAARAVPDGYTLLVGNVSTNAINETTFAQSMRTMPSRDLVGVTNLIEIPHIVAATTSLPANDIKQFIDLAKRPESRINYGSAGIGTYPHLDMVVFAKAAGVEVTHVPFKGGAGQMVPGLISGEVQVMFVNLASSLPQVRAGRMKALATTAPQRLPELPAVATMTEQGYPGIGTNAWNGLFAPAAVPKAVLQRVYAQVVEILQRPEMREMLAKQLMTVNISTSPAAYTDFVKTETRKWANVVKENNIRIE